MRSQTLLAALLLAMGVGAHGPALARGGHGGFHMGFHGGGFGRLGLASDAKAPAYVVVDVTETTDEQAFKTLVTNTASAAAGFGGHLMVDADRATALDGAAPQRLVIIRFDNLASAQAWKDSPSFKDFDTARAQSVKSRAFMVEGLPAATPTAEQFGGPRRMRYDPKPFEEIIKKRDRDLDRIKDICKGC